MARLQKKERFNHELRDAIRSSDLEKLNEILNKEIDINACDDKKLSYLHYALYWKEYQAIHLLINKGIDVDLKSETGKTALLIAAERCYTEAVKYLVEHGADINYANQQDKNKTALHYAAENARLETIEYLVNLDIDINVKDSIGKTALHYLAGHANDSQTHLRCLKFLLKQARFIDDLDNEGNTVLHLAVKRMNFERVKLLMQYGANPVQVNMNGETPYSIACDIKQNDVMNFLMPYVQAQRENESLTCLIKYNNIGNTLEF